MNTDEIFIDANKLPKALSKEETYDLLRKIQQDDDLAKKKLAEHNIRLVISNIYKKFPNVEYDKKDLISIGNIGLLKAISSFDISKNIEFSTYAIRCIDNEILMFLRKLKKHENVDSLDRTINYSNDGSELKIKDTLSDDIDIEKEYTDNEMHYILREILNDLPEYDKNILMLHFGFYNDKQYKQKEIADMLSLSQPQVSRIITRSVKRIGNILEEKGIVELRKKDNSKNISKSKEAGSDKMGRKLKTIYEYFNTYTQEEVNAVLKKLSEEELELITLRYGTDLNNPIKSKLNQEQHQKFYGCLIPKMKRLLANPYRKRKRSSIQQNEIIVTSEINEETLNVIPVEYVNKEVLEPNSKLDEIIKEEAIEVQEHTVDKIITKNDCHKILELLRTASFNDMMSILSVKESVIISLKLGYIDGKYFTTEEISNFLGIEKQEVIDTTMKILFLYKENINQFIDNVIQIVNEENEIQIDIHTKSLKVRNM